MELSIPVGDASAPDELVPRLRGQHERLARVLAESGSPASPELADGALARACKEHLSALGDPEGPDRTRQRLWTVEVPADVGCHHVSAVVKLDGHQASVVVTSSADSPGRSAGWWTQAAGVGLVVLGAVLMATVVMLPIGLLALVIGLILLVAGGAVRRLAPGPSPGSTARLDTALAEWSRHP